MKNTDKHGLHAVISFSGGMDSSSLLFTMLSQGYQKIHCFGFDYGQRHAVELKKSRDLINFLNENGFEVEYQLINVRDVFSDSQSALGANKAADVPENEYNTENLKVTVVENRNVIFSSIIYAKALSISKKYNVDVDIALGVHNSDEAVYPDCRPASTEMAKELYRISNYGSERINYVTPFIHITKTDVLKAGLEALVELDLPVETYYHTSSCYNPTEDHDIVLACGKCATCLDRLKAFKVNGLEDPIAYKEQ